MATVYLELRAHWVCTVCEQENDYDDPFPPKGRKIICAACGAKHRTGHSGYPVVKKPQSRAISEDL